VGFDDQRATITVSQFLSTRLKPSYLLAIVLFLVHFMCIYILLLLELSRSIKLLIAILIALSCIYYVRKDALLLAENSIVSLEFYENKQCRVITRARKSFDCMITTDSFVTSIFAVVIFKLDKPLFLRSFFSAVLLPDNIDENEFRKLRIWLRWKYY